jgi:hypothetical protein
MSIVEVEKIWTTQDGRKIPIKDMSTDHIEKCICMMKNNGYVSMGAFLFYLFGPKPNGDAANLAFEQECDIIFSKTPSEYLDWLEYELESRGKKC